MKYLEVMEVLSQFDFGAVLLSEDNKILTINEAGDRLLHGDGKLVGAKMPEAAMLLCEESNMDRYVSIAFGEYLCRCAAPVFPDLPPKTELIVFREAIDDACHDMLIAVLNGLEEAVILFDAQGRIYLINDAAVNLDSMVTSDVLGKHVSEVYNMQDGNPLAVPQVIKDKRPILKRRQYYTTCFGRNVDTVANIYPIMQNGQTLGAFNVLQDWSTTTKLHNQIINLQDKLLEQPSKSEKKRKSALTAKYEFNDIIHISPAMDEVVTRCKKIAKSDSSVMIYGETGTGKELLAQSIHNASGRADGPFLAINCAAIPDNLLEGLLFGTEKGAYTGAESRAGLFEQADRGTLLLDEINSMNIVLQAKLLRVLQGGMLRRVGGINEIQTDVRVLSNTNIPPHQAIEQNQLRRDLFYRLGVININIPPLRDHKEDIPLLSKKFILHLNKKLHKNIRNVDRATLEIFNSYDWPGNTRELEHAIEYAMNILPDDQSLIRKEYIPEHILHATAPPARILTRPPESSPLTEEAQAPVQNTDSTVQNSTMQTPSRAAHEAERSVQNKERPAQGTDREILENALIENGGNISKTARALGVSRQNLQYHLKRLDIDVKAFSKWKG